jgi:hypothetical protein
LTGPSIRGVLAVISVGLLFALLLDRVRFAHAVRTVGGAHDPWWFGYARDAVALGALVSFFAAYRTAGYSAAAALLLGGLALLIEWGLHETLGERFGTRRTLALTLSGTLAAMAPTLLWPGRVDAAVHRLLGALF